MESTERPGGHKPDACYPICVSVLDSDDESDKDLPPDEPRFIPAGGAESETVEDDQEAEAVADQKKTLVRR